MISECITQRQQHGLAAGEALGPHARGCLWSESGGEQQSRQGTGAAQHRLEGHIGVVKAAPHLLLAPRGLLLPAEPQQQILGALGHLDVVAEIALGSRLSNASCWRVSWVVRLLGDNVVF